MDATQEHKALIEAGTAYLRDRDAVNWHVLHSHNSPKYDGPLYDTYLTARDELVAAASEYVRVALLFPSCVLCNAPIDEERSRSWSVQVLFKSTGDSRSIGPFDTRRCLDAYISALNGVER